MAEHDISLVTAKAGSVIAENMKVSLATAAGALTPSTITAMVGIHNGTALKLAPTVTTALGKLHYSNIADPGLWSAANIARANLTNFQANLMPAGNHAAFGSYLNQAQGHIADATELKTATDFISTTSFSDYGTGITNMSSMTTQGLDGALGDLGSAAKAFEAAGPVFDLKDMSKFGTSAGLIDKLNTVKLGNASGINGAIAGAGLDLSMPEHTAQVDRIMTSINDPKVISTVVEQLGISPPGGVATAGSEYSNTWDNIAPNSTYAPTAATAKYFTKNTLGSDASPLGSDARAIDTPSTSYSGTTGVVSTRASASLLPTGDYTTAPLSAAELPTTMARRSVLPTVAGINNLKDLTDLNKLANPNDVAGLTGGLNGMASKFSDMGAKFSSPAAAAGMCSAIEVPSIPNLEAAAPSLSGLMSGMSTEIDTMVSGGLPITGSVPSMTDFMQHVAGGPHIDALNSDVNATTIAALNTSVTQTSSAFANIGIDLTAPPMPSMGSSMNFATSLHKYGADASGSGVADILKNMANTASPTGDAIVASLAEGKNKALMMAQGIAPLKFGG